MVEVSRFGGAEVGRLGAYLGAIHVAVGQDKRRILGVHQFLGYMADKLRVVLL